MLKKVLKIKGVEGRTALVEFTVNKRVKYLEYLKELHSEEGSLWMNTVHLNLHEIGKYFNIADACLPQDGDGVSKEGLIQLPAEKPVAASGSVNTASAVGDAGQPNSSVNSGSADPHHAAGPYMPGPDLITVSLADAPAAIRQRSSSAADWARYYLPCYAALAISLSEILLIPIGGEEFVECFYGLLLELEVAYASGAASKALAQRNLRQFRQHVSPGLKALLQTSTDAADTREAPLTSPAVTSSADLDAQIKYLFLNQRHLEYSATSPSYDAVIPALCSVLMFAYRKLCDYELMRDDECVRRILSVDKRLERLFAHVSHEIDKIANHKLLREAYLLSTGALFADLADVASRAGAVGGAVSIPGGADFVADLLNQQQQRRGAASPTAAGKKGFDSSDDDDEASGWSGPEEEAQ